MRCCVAFFLLLVAAVALHAEERSHENTFEYLPDAAASEAARKGERQAKRIQQRRKERGSAGRIAVKTPRAVAQLRAYEREARHEKRSEVVQAVIDAFSDPRVRVLPVLTRRSVGVAISITTGKGKREPSDWGWLYDDDDEEEDADAPRAGRSTPRGERLTRAEKTYINKDSDQRGNRKKLRAKAGAK